MTGLLIAFSIVLLVPLFVGTWRTSLLGLALQGALMAAIAIQRAAAPSIDDAVTLFDLVVVRMIAAPAALYFVLRVRDTPHRNDVIAPNLFSWGLALALVVAAFRAADALVPVESDEQMLVAISASALLLGLLVLAMGLGTLSGIIGVLRIENALALFELGAPNHHEALAIRIGKAALVLLSVGFYRWYLIHDAPDAPAPPSSARPVL